MDVPRRIRELRYLKGWSTVELASRATISRSALNQLESGTTNKPHADTLKRIARALGVPMEALLEPTPVRNGRSARLPAHAAASPVVRPESATQFSSARVEELVEIFTLLLSSPLAEAIARIVEESSRLIPIIPPSSASAGPYAAPRRDSPNGG